MRVIPFGNEVVNAGMSRLFFWVYTDSRPNASSQSISCKKETNERGKKNLISGSKKKSDISDYSEKCAYIPNTFLIYLFLF